MSLAKLRTLALKLPEAHEVEAWGEPTFRVKNKLFAMYAAPNNHHGAGRAAVWVKAAPGMPISIKYSSCGSPNIFRYKIYFSR